MAIIGTAYVHIRADDKYFESDVRKATARIKNVNIQLKADVDLTKASKKIRDLRYRITSKDAVLKVDANVEKAEAKMAKLLAKFLKSDVEVKAVAKTTEANAQLDALRNKYTAKGIPFTAQADTRAANAALKTLTAERSMNVRALVDPTSQKALQGMFNTLTGTISANKIKATIAGLAGNFEGLATKGTAIAAAIGAISGSVLNLGANLLSIGGDITSVIGLTALFPAAFGSMISIIFATKMAFKDFGGAFSSDAKKAAESLAKLPPEAQKAVKGIKGVYTEIQKPVQKAFWKEMGTSLQDTVRTLLPQLKTGLSNVGQGWGMVMKETLLGFKRLGDNQGMERMLNGVAGMLTAISVGMGPLINAFNTLGIVGSSYLPEFGVWLSDLAIQFESFITKAEAAGDINRWIEEGVASLQDMGSILKSTAGIFSGLTAAARMAGAPGLDDMAESLRNIRDIVNGEPFQSRLVTVLEGARSGAEKMGAGFKNLTTFVGESSVALGIFLDKSGEIAGLTFDSIRSLFDGTGLGAGLYEALRGFETMLADLQPGFADLGSAIGGLGEIAGEMFRNLAPGLNQLFETIEGVVNGVKQGVIDAMPVFNEFIQMVLELVQGPIIELATQIGNLLTAFSNLPGPIQNLIMTLGLFAIAFNLLRPKWAAFTGGLRKQMADTSSSVGNNLRNMQNGFREMGGAFSRVSVDAAERGVRSFDGFGKSVGDTMRATATGMRANVGTAFNSMPGWAQRAASGVKGAFASFGAGLINGANLNRELDTVRQGLARLPESSRLATDQIKENFRSGLSNIGNFIAPAGSAVRKMATEMHGNLAPARDAFTNLTQHAATATRNAATQIGSGLKSAMGGLAGFLGGGWGIAFLGATVLMMEFATQQARAKSQVDNLAAAFENSGGKIDATARKVVATNLQMKESFFGMEFPSSFDIAKKVGVPLEDVVDAASGVPGAMERIQISLGQSGDAATKFGTMFGGALDVLAKGGGPLANFADLIDKTGLFQSEGDKLNGMISEQKRVMEEAKQKNEDLAASLGIGTVASKRLSENYDTLRDSTASVSSKVEALKDNLDILNGSVISARKAGRDHAETMFNLEDAMKNLHGATDKTIDANGRMEDSFRQSLLGIDGGFSTANRSAIDFSKEMDTVATSIVTLGIQEMKRLEDIGKGPAEATAGAMEKMRTSTNELRTKLGTLGFDAGQVNTIISQLGLDPEKLQGALTVDTKDAENNILRLEIFKSAVMSGNWEVALTASSEQVQNTILGTERLREAYKNGGWEAVAKLKDDTGKGFGELMSKIALAKDESEITAILKASFPDSDVFDNAKAKAEAYGKTEVNAALGVTDNATVPIGIATQAMIGYNMTPTLDKVLKGVDLTGEAVASANTNLTTGVTDVTKSIFGSNQTAPAVVESQGTLDSVTSVTRDLFGNNAAQPGRDAAQGTLNSFQNVMRDASVNNAAALGTQAAQGTVNTFKGKSVDLDANDNATPVVNAVNNKGIANKSFTISALFDGATLAIKHALGLAHGGILNSAGVQTFANGGILEKAAAPAVKAYANGGFENHVAQIAYKTPSVPLRIWAEAEGGEAYIPLAKSKRKRSLEILRQVMAEFGLENYAMFADGGFNNKAVKPTVVSSRYTTTSDQMSQAAGPSSAGSTINFTVQPSQGLSEQQIGESAMRELYWQIASR